MHLGKGGIGIMSVARRPTCQSDRHHWDVYYYDTYEEDLPIHAGDGQINTHMFQIAPMRAPSWPWPCLIRNPELYVTN